MSLPSNQPGPAFFPRLSPEDVSRLLRDPSDANRMRVARKVGAGLSSEKLTAAERALAEDIVRRLAQDAIVQVRAALAESVKATPALPHDIAWQLALDVEQVALPILQFSQSLTDDDLIQIIEGGDPTRQGAIAIRPAVSPIVANSLIEHGNEGVVVELFRNRGAKIDETGFDRALDRFGEGAVPDAMARRERLPPDIAARLIDLVSESLQSQLMARYNLAPGDATALVSKTRERAAKALYTNSARSTDPFLRAREMIASRRLTPTSVLRAVCLGDVPFFEASLAVMADIPLTNARILVRDSGSLGLKSLLHKANIPISLLPLFRVALAIARELDPELETDEYLFRRRSIAVHTLKAHADMAGNNVDVLLTRLDSYAATPDGFAEIVHFVS